MERVLACREALAMPLAALFIDRTDVIMSQGDNFLYYLSQKIPYAAGRSAEVAYPNMMGSGNVYWLSFRTEAQRDAFERGVAEFMRMGKSTG